jgi:hypothetical protein
MGLLKEQTVGHRSFSSFTSWVQCGKKWQLERELHVPTQPAWALVGGSSVHLALERYLRETLEQDTNV